MDIQLKLLIALSHASTRLQRRLFCSYRSKPSFFGDIASIFTDLYTRPEISRVDKPITQEIRDVL